jgi:hypothetical protein
LQRSTSGEAANFASTILRPKCLVHRHGRVPPSLAIKGNGITVSLFHTTGIRLSGRDECGRSHAVARSVPWRLEQAPAYSSRQMLHEIDREPTRGTRREAPRPHVASTRGPRPRQHGRAAANDEVVGMSAPGFCSDVGAFVDRDVILSCVMPSVRELMPARTITYRAFCDPSGGSLSAASPWRARRAAPGSSGSAAWRRTLSGEISNRAASTCSR